MRLATVFGASLLVSGATLFLPVAEARPGPMLGSPGSADSLLLQVDDKKTQKDMNKFCPAGKVFMEGKGCVKREKAEKAKKKEEKEKQKGAATPNTPPPSSPPPPPEPIVK